MLASLAVSTSPIKQLYVRASGREGGSKSSQLISSRLLLLHHHHRLYRHWLLAYSHRVPPQHIESQIHLLNPTSNPFLLISSRKDSLYCVAQDHGSYGIKTLQVTKEDTPVLCEEKDSLEEVQAELRVGGVGRHRIVDCPSQEREEGPERRRLSPLAADGLRCDATAIDRTCAIDRAAACGPRLGIG